MPFRLSDVIHRTADGDLPALTHDGQTSTYAELHGRSARVAAGLAARGLGPGSRVAWIGKNRTELFDLLLGAPRIRAVTVPLNNRLTVAELLEIVDDAGAALVVLGPDFAHLRSDVAERTGVLVVGEDYEELLDPSAPPLPHEGAHPEARDDDTVLQLYTSGTTGPAKGVLVSHRQLGALLGAGEHWAMDHDVGRPRGAAAVPHRRDRVCGHLSGVRRPRRARRATSCPTGCSTPSSTRESPTRSSCPPCCSRWWRSPAPPSGTGRRAAGHRLRRVADHQHRAAQRARHVRLSRCSRSTAPPRPPAPSPSSNRRTTTPRARART